MAKRSKVVNPAQYRKAPKKDQAYIPKINHSHNVKRSQEVRANSDFYF